MLMQSQATLFLEPAEARDPGAWEVTGKPATPPNPGVLDSAKMFALNALYEYCATKIVSILCRLTRRVLEPASSTAHQ